MLLALRVLLIGVTIANGLYACAYLLLWYSLGNAVAMVIFTLISGATLAAIDDDVWKLRHQEKTAKRASEMWR
jgi:hypothetical protein